MAWSAFEIHCFDPRPGSPMSDFDPPSAVRYPPGTSVMDQRIKSGSRRQG
jgi:hypothetical protein